MNICKYVYCKTQFSRSLRHLNVSSDIHLHVLNIDSLNFFIHVSDDMHKKIRYLIASSFT